VILRRTSLSANIVQFCRYLRVQNFTIGPDDEALSLQAMQLVDFIDPSIFHLVLKSSFCKSKIETEEFDTLFTAYWKDIGQAVDAKIKKRVEKKQLPAFQPAAFKSLKTWLHGNRNEETEEISTYSYYENLSRKDFSAVPNEDVDELMRIIKELAKRLAAKRGKRYSLSQKNVVPDLRQTLRQNLRWGGELLELAWRKPKRNRVKLVMLCDVSKSMELYTAFLIQFVFAFQQVYKRIETFTFGTSLKRITSLLKNNNFGDALHLLSVEENGWEGGTRIGESLDVFVNLYSKRLLDSKTVVLIVSDGWDKGNSDLLKKNMEFIHEKAKTIIWLNPLAGFESFQPEVVGMQIAMPFIDVFQSVHNVESLRRLGKLL
jgi:uncharacterized protein with von Willebrand factor type A (vWA) domain